MDFMKKIVSLFIILLSLSSSPVLLAQETNDEPRTLFSLSNIAGGYGATSHRYAQVSDRHCYVNGGEAAVVLNSNLALGIAGAEFTSQHEYDDFLSEDAHFTGGYGGFLLLPIFWGQKTVHLTTPVLVGAGGMAYKEKDFINQDGRHEAITGFFFVQPGIEVEVNLFRFMRLAAGAYYTYAPGTELSYKASDKKIPGSANALNDFSYGMTLRLGRFAPK